MIIVGVGNPLKSDDNIGNIVAQKLKRGNTIIAEGNPESYVSKMRGERTVIFIDAVEFNGNIGEVRLFSPSDMMEVPGATHAVPVNFFKKMLPRTTIYVIGIQHKSVDFGEKLTPELEKLLPKILEDTEELLSGIFP